MFKELDALAEKVSNSLLNYLYLWTWLDQKITNFLSQWRVHKFQSVEYFWNRKKYGVVFLFVTIENRLITD